MSLYTGKRFVNPLNKNIGRRTGKDFRAGKTIRIGKDGFENLEDYFSESDADVTREFSRRHASTIREESDSAGSQENLADDELKENQSYQSNTLVQNASKPVLSNVSNNNITSSQSMSQLSQNRSKFGWLRNRNIGRRTGKNITANKQIRVNDNGFENFEDYLSESDVSTMSSRLSVSIVKPVPRYSNISNLVVGDNTQSEVSQESQSDDGDNSGDEEEIEDIALSSEKKSRSNSSRSETHQLVPHNQTEEEIVDIHPFNERANKSSSMRSGKTDRSTLSDSRSIRADGSTLSDSRKSGRTETLSKSGSRETVWKEVSRRSEITDTITRNSTQLDESNPHENETTSKSGTAINKSLSQTVNSEYIETPVSSRRSRSITNVSRLLNKSEHSENKTYNNSRNKSDISRHSVTQKLESKVDKSKNERDSVETSKHSDRSSKIVTDNDSEYEELETEDGDSSENDQSDDEERESNVDSCEDVENEDEELKNDRKEFESGDEDEDAEKEDGSEEDGEKSETDEEEVEGDMSEEHDLEDHESADENSDYERDDGDEMIEKTNDEDGVKDKSKVKDSNHDKSTKSFDKAESLNLKDSTVENKLSSKNVKDMQIPEIDDDRQLESDGDDNEDSDIRPSQATNIDVAGNKSGSITKLDIPTSIVSFNRTRKRLSYSAMDASEESIKRNRSRIEKANSELFKQDESTGHKKEDEDSKTSDIPEKQRHTESVGNKTMISDNKTMTSDKTALEDRSEFLSLAARSVLPSNIDDDEDDFDIIDFEKSKVKKKRTAKGNNKKDITRSDSYNQGQGENKRKSTKQGSKSEVKKQKRKDNVTGKSAQSSNKSIDLSHETVFDNSSADRFSEKEDNDVNDTDSVDNTINNKTVDQSQKKNMKNQNQSLKGISKSNRKRNKSSDVDISQKEEFNSENLEQAACIEEMNENLDEEKSAIQEKQNAKQTSRKTKTEASIQSDTEVSKLSVKKSKQKKMARKEQPDDTCSSRIQKECENSDVKEMPDVNLSKAVKKSEKKQTRKSENKNKDQTVFDHIDEENKEIVNDKGQKKKSSDESMDYNEDKRSKTKSAKNLKANFGIKRKTKTKQGRKKSSDDKADASDAVDNTKTDVQEPRMSTPHVNSRVSLPTQFGSGLSFRVSRRSEMLEAVGSGYIGDVTEHAEKSVAPTLNTSVFTENIESLTPCISRPGAARKSKGRRVTICPDDSIRHFYNGDNKTPTESKRSRWSIDTSGNATPLPDPDSTPVHYCETTHSSTPEVVELSIMDDKLIKPSPPEEGLRRSQRTRVKPIAWYKNERIVYTTDSEIIGVKPSLEVKWNKLEEEKRKRRLLKNEIRKASKSVKPEKPYKRLSIHQPLPEGIEVDDEQNMEITVFDDNLQAEGDLACIGKRDAFKEVGPTYRTPKKEDPYVIMKVLDHHCMTAGKLHIKPNALKPEQLVVGDYIVFFIEYGKLLVTLHKTSFLVETGDTFMVPVGNSYSILNLRADTAKLFFTIHKQPEESTNNAQQD